MLSPKKILVSLVCLLAVSLFSASAEIVISEFMASNSSTLADEDSEFSDWIEITNTGNTAEDLNGWYLTDNSDYDVLDPQSLWTFPARQIAAGESLVVFASGKDRKPAAPGELHTNFQLSAGGEYLALIEPDGTTIATEFAPEFPKQETDVSYGTGASALSTLDFVGEGADTLVLVPADAGIGPSWTGGSEPFNDAAWTTAKTGVGFDTGSGPSGFTLIDSFDSLNAGALDGQDGWAASSASAIVANDPANVENQVLAFSGDNVRAWKPMSIANGTTATLFYRMRRDGIVDFSIGATDIATPGTAYSDFETQANNQKNDRLNARDAGSFDDVNELADNTWYEIWMVINNSSDTYKIYMRGGSLVDQTLLASGAQTDFGFRNGTAANAMANFYARTGSGTLGTWSIDDVYLAPGSNLSSPSGGLSLESFINPSGDIETAMSGINSSAYLRIPFEVEDPGAFASLTLRMRYDDGFVAYLNGTQIAARNAPVSPAWNSTATAEHPNQDVVQFESIDITASAGLLVPNSTNVLAVHGLNLSAADGDFLLTPELTGVKSGTVAQLLFFTAPTPGLANGAGILGFVGDTQFSVDRGFYDTPFDVVISSNTPGAEIIYTTDGSTPSDTNGTSAIAPATVSITTTTPLRALASKQGFLPTNVDTHTYIFVEDVINQGNSHTGYPTTWKGDGGGGSFPADYEMDPEITGSAAYSSLIDDALLAVPTISLVTEKENLFDPATGIYQNPQQHGSAWERPVSFEVIHPDGTTQGIQVDAGFRIQGGHTRLPSKNPKHSFRLSFTRDFGPSKLNYDLFRDDPDATEEFDQLILRGAGNQSWLHHNNFKGDNRGRAQYIRDQWAKDTQLAMGHPAVRSMYAHVYINGIYWGLYNPTERGTAGFGESYLGGDKDDYQTLNSGEAIDGVSTRADYDALIALANAGLANSANYAQMATLLDLEAFTDYMLIHQYGANLDWDHHNWYALRNKNGGQWYFLCWDSEFVFISENDNVLSLNNSDDPTRIWQQLLDNPEYRILFADRVQKHMFNGGLLTPNSVMTMWDTRKDQMFDAIVAESARWGDYRRDVDPTGAPSPIPLYDRDEEWMAERTRLFTSYFPVRTDNVIAQYRSAGYFPNIDAPEFSVLGGQVAPGFVIDISSLEGDIYYTTDGSDPRLEGGTINQAAGMLNGGSTLNSLISLESTGWQYLDTGADLGSSDIVVGHAAYGTGNWKHPAFNDTAWKTGQAMLGYGGITGGTINTTVDFGGIASTRHATTHLRKEFNIAGASSYIELRIDLRRDDGVIAYLNGREIARSNMPSGTVDFDTLASTSIFGSSESAPNLFTYSLSPGELLEGTNVLAIEVHQQSLGSNDLGIDVQLDGLALTDSQGFALNDSSVVRARTLLNGEWSAITEATFLVGTVASSSNTVVSEIMYNPAVGGSEFIELANVSQSPIDASGVHFGSGIDFTVPIGTTIPPGGFYLITNFENGTALANGGETITLLAADGSIIESFRYDDDAPWPVSPDGSGPSLTRILPPSAPSDPASWRPSVSNGGSPADTDAVPFAAADPAADDDNDGLNALLEHAFGTDDSTVDNQGDLFTISLDGTLDISLQQNLTADDIEWSFERSTDLENWQPADSDVLLQGSTDNQNGTATLRFSVVQNAGERYFWRARATQR